MTRNFRLLCCGLPVLVALTGCDSLKSKNPLSPSVAQPIPGVNITTPKPLEPSIGAEIAIDAQPVTLKIENASSNGARPLTYAFEVATDAQFGSKVFSRQGIAPGTNGRTELRLPDPLEPGRTYYWRARAEDGNNTGAFGSAHFNLFTPIVIETPAALSPANGVRLSTRHPEFRASSVKRSGPVGTIAYSFHVSTHESFNDTVALVTLTEQPGYTKFNLAQELDYDRVYYWRVRAFDPNVSSAWSSTQAFRTPVEPPPPPPPPKPDPPPSPGPGPGPGPAPGGGPCTGSPINIVTCERDKYGHMSSSQTVSFLKAVARDLNAGGGSYGILRKTSGSQCNGYSCDIICAGNGNGQRQWDVLRDAEGAQSPTWGGPHTVPNIRIDTCEIQ